MTKSDDISRLRHTVSIVIPIYSGEFSIRKVVEELLNLGNSVTAGSAVFEIAEILLVHDCGPDNSDSVIRDLERQYPQVRAIWLARNYGQHAALLAGMSSSRGDWIVTVDEDGQHDPAEIAELLKAALATKADLVYGRNRVVKSHGLIRGLSSLISKHFVCRFVTSGTVRYFSSFRLILGEKGRTLAAFSTSDVYLDVALSWVINKTIIVDVSNRKAIRETSTYDYKRLVSHFVRLLLTAGTRPLRIAGAIGISSFVVGLCLVAVLLFGKIRFGFPVNGWASTTSLLLVGGGLVLLVLGVIAEYLGIVVKAALGRPIYVIVNDPADSALNRNI